MSESEEARIGVPKSVLDNMYIAMLDGYNETSSKNLRRCLNWLEKECEYRPPEVCGYMDELESEKKP